MQARCGEELRQACETLEARLREEAWRDAAAARKHQEEERKRSVAEALATAEARARKELEEAQEAMERVLAEAEARHGKRMEAADAAQRRVLADKEKEAQQRAEAAVRETARKALEDKQQALLDAEERWRHVIKVHRRTPRPCHVSRPCLLAQTKYARRRVMSSVTPAQEECSWGLSPSLILSKSCGALPHALPCVLGSSHAGMLR